MQSYRNKEIPFASAKNPYRTPEKHSKNREDPPDHGFAPVKKPIRNKKLPDG
jgi:hypothetical protein